MEVDFMPCRNPIISGRQLSFYGDSEEFKKEEQEALETFARYLEDYSSGKSIVCLTLSNPNFKEYALTYLCKEKSMFCVENKTIATEGEIYYALTFVDNNYEIMFCV